MQETHPTLIVAVPRVYEKIYNQVQNKSHGIKHAIVKWALSVGAANRETVLRGETPTVTVLEAGQSRWCSPRCVRVWAGGHDCFVSGGAPLGREIATWYRRHRYSSSTKVTD